MSLLAVLVIVQGFSVYATNIQSSACGLAIEAALALQDGLQPNLDQMSDNYETDVYDNSDNINQQTFRAAEYQFLTQHIIPRQNAAILAILSTCKLN